MKENHLELSKSFGSISKFKVILNYWGKTDKKTDYHILTCHQLDVAAVAKVYLGIYKDLADAVVNSLGLPREIAINLVLFFISIHDLGKFSRAFQSKNPDLFKSLQSRSLNISFFSVSHDILGLGLWENKFQKLEGLYVFDKSDLNILAAACMGHHGKPVDSFSRNKLSQYFGEQDIEAAECHVRLMYEFFLEPHAKVLNSLVVEDDFKYRCQRFSWWLSGITILADWLGSNKYYFPYKNCQRFNEEYVNFNNYWQDAQDKARKVLIENGLVPPVPNMGLTLADFFKLENSKEFSPTSLQSKISKLDFSAIRFGQLIIMEDLTGSGKTEAALFAAYRLIEAGKADGVYFALPTMATSNAMYQRLEKVYKGFYKNSEDISFVLSHSNRKIADKLLNLNQIQTEDDVKNEPESASLRYNAWFVDNQKKSLHAHFGVGTIDQLFMAILHSRHSTLRLLGLFRKVLIVDEVHACDSYMFELLKTLIEFHAASGGHTILASATLPKKMRKNLINSYYRVLTNSVSSDEIKIESDSYPLLTHVNADQIFEYALNNDIDSGHNIKVPAKRVVQVKIIPNKGEIFEYIKNQLNQDYCVCWVRNTVADAVDAYRNCLRFVESEKIDLFHSRFMLQDRLNIEKKIIDLFGSKKGLNEQNRKGRLLIATQVVEQSLDIDFDCMVSDLAPIDLLIQRVGRLQRHERGKRIAPLLIVFGPLPDVEVEENWYGSENFFPKGQYVYPHHGRLWLTAKLIQEKQFFTLPQDTRDLIEGVYGDEANWVPSNLQRSQQKAEAEEAKKRNMGSFMTLNYQGGYALNTSNEYWWNEAQTPTRDGEAQITAYFAKEERGEVRPLYVEAGDDWETSRLNIECPVLDREKYYAMYPELLKKSMVLPGKGKYAVMVLFNQGNDGIATATLINQKNKATEVTYTNEYGLLFLD